MTSARIKCLAETLFKRVERCSETNHAALNKLAYEAFRIAQVAREKSEVAS
jgi:hypothetical protein